MPRLPRRRRATALLAAAALALTVSACGADGPPEITYYAHGATAVGGPLVLCSLDFRSCAPAGLPARLDVPPGDPLQISLPADIFNAPWRLITIYLDKGGAQRSKDQYFKPGAQLAVTVRPGPGEVLQGVEIQLPSGATDADGNPVARGAWSLQNTYAPRS